jgi:hypothetical protein
MVDGIKTNTDRIILCPLIRMLNPSFYIKAFQNFNNKFPFSIIIYEVGDNNEREKRDISYTILTSGYAVALGIPDYYKQIYQKYSG